MAPSATSATQKSITRCQGGSVELSAGDALASLSGRTFPPVGAADLLGDPQPLAAFLATAAAAEAAGGASSDEDGGPAVLAADWAVCDVGGAAAAASLAGAIASAAAAAPALARMAARARRRALAWTEAGTARSLIAIVAAARGDD